MSENRTVATSDPLDLDAIARELDQLTGQPFADRVKEIAKGTPDSDLPSLLEQAVASLHRDGRPRDLLWAGALAQIAGVAGRFNANREWSMLLQAAGIMREQGDAAWKNLGKYYLARASLARGGHAASLAGFTECRAYYLQANQAHDVASCDLYMSEIYTNTHRLTEALERMEAARDHFLVVGDALQAENCELRRVDPLISLQRHDEALSIIESAERSPSRDNLPWAAVRRADILLAQDRFADAVAGYRSGLDLYARIGDDRGRIDASLRLAQALDLLGRVDESMAVLKSAHAQVSSRGSMQDMPYFYAALSWRLAVADDRDGCLSMLKDIAGLQQTVEFLASGDSCVGARLLEETVKLYRVTGDELGAAQTEVMRAEILAMHGRHADALAAIDSAGGVILEYAGPITVARYHATRARAREREGDLEGALSGYLAAKELLDSQERQDHSLAQVLKGLSRIHRLLGDDDSSLSGALASCDAFERVIADLGGSESDEAAFLDSQVSPFGIAIGHILNRAWLSSEDDRASLISQAFTLAERSRSRRLREELARSLRTGQATIARLDEASYLRWRHYVSQLHALDRRQDDAGLRSFPGSTQDDVAVASIRAAILKELDELESTLFRQEMESGSILLGRLPDLADVLSALDEQEVLASYYRLNEGLVVFWADRHGVKGFEWLGDATAELNRHLTTLANLVSERATEGPRGWDASLRRLGEILLAPLETAGALSGIARLTVVPSAGLYAVPWAALTLPGSGQPLVKQVAVSVVPQAVTRLFQSQKQPMGAKRIAVIDPDATLEYSAHERESLKAHTEDIYFREERGPVDASRLSEIFREASSLHIACHGVFEAESPLSSALIMGPPGAPERVSARRLYGFDARLELIVANACESSRSLVTNGDSYLGLTRALLYLSRTVVGALWRVDDEAAAEFARELHLAMSQGGDPIQATASAQRSMMMTTGFAHPYYWAGFQASG